MRIELCFGPEGSTKPHQGAIANFDVKLEEVEEFDKLTTICHDRFEQVKEMLKTTPMPIPTEAMPTNLWLGHKTKMSVFNSVIWTSMLDDRQKSSTRAFKLQLLFTTNTSSLSNNNTNAMIHDVHVKVLNQVCKNDGKIEPCIGSHDKTELATKILKLTFLSGSVSIVRDYAITTNIAVKD